MPKYTGVQVPRDAEVIGRTNRRLKLPFIKPRTDHEHDANVRKLEQWGNQLPFTPGGGGHSYSILRMNVAYQDGVAQYGFHEAVVASADDWGGFFYTADSIDDDGYDGESPGIQYQWFGSL